MMAWYTEEPPWMDEAKKKTIKVNVMDPIKYPSSTCPLYKKEDEDEYHFVVGCHLKWEAWKKGLDIVQYPSSSYIQPLVSGKLFYCNIE
jgi:hypothetical protein